MAFVSSYATRVGIYAYVLVGTAHGDFGAGRAMKRHLHRATRLQELTTKCG